MTGERNQQYQRFRRAWRWLTGAWVIVNLLLIAFLNTPVVWEIYRFFRDNVYWVLLGSTGLFAFPVVLRMIAAFRWGRRGVRHMFVGGAIVVGLVLCQLVFLALIAFSSTEFMCTTQLAHRHVFEPYGKSIVVYRHDCIPDGNETWYVKSRYSPFLTQVGFRATPIAQGEHDRYYTVKGNLLFIEMVDQTIVYNLDNGAVEKQR